MAYASADPIAAITSSGEGSMRGLSIVPTRRQIRFSKMKASITKRLPMNRNPRVASSSFSKIVTHIELIRGAGSFSASSMNWVRSCVVGKFLGGGTGPEDPVGYRLILLERRVVRAADEKRGRLVDPLPERGCRRTVGGLRVGQDVGDQQRRLRSRS